MKIINLDSKNLASFYVACELFKQIQQHPHAKLGLATGGTMTDVYHYLVNLLIKNKVDVSQVETFNLDEYVGLKASHQQSYHTYMNNNLLDERGPIDIQILGIGENGHIGFNEPGTDFNSETHVVNLTESTIKANSRFFDNEKDVPRQAVSMGVKSILKAKRIILLAFGPKKKEAISKLLNEQVTEDVPATILHTHPNVEVYVDDEAAPDCL